MDAQARDEIHELAERTLRVVEAPCGAVLDGYGRRFVCERPQHEGTRHETANGRLTWIAQA